MIKDIFVNLSLNDTADHASRFAISLASVLDAHLAAVAYCYEIEVPEAVFGPGMTPMLIDTHPSESHERAQAASARYHEVARLSGVQATCRTCDATISRAAKHFGRTARAFSLAVVSQPERDSWAPEGLLIESALFSAGRPVIVVPYIHVEGANFDHITVCWDGGRAAARAVADAMPLLRKSKIIELLVVEESERDSEEILGLDIAEHLARHSLNVELKRTHAANIAVGDAIVSRVADSGSDFLVMGGYGHSRLREWVLGGVTESMLTQMTIPTLMSN